MISILKQTVLMIQETMLEGKIAKETINEFVKDQKMERMDSNKHSRGILTVCSAWLNLILVTKHESILETKLKDGQAGMDFTSLNVYRPFYNMTVFWETFYSSSAMSKINVILGGYLNLTLMMSEVWGENARHDSLSSFFMDFFERRKLVDVAPLKLEPTQRNKRGGAQDISKILDLFLVGENLFNGNIILQSTIEAGGIFDHRPITVTVKLPRKKNLPPLKSTCFD